MAEILNAVAVCAAMQPIRISGKHLGALSLPDFCPRCFWVRLKCRDKIPFTFFPGIFSSIDPYTKKVTSFHHEKYSKVPKWLNGFGELGKPLPVPPHSKFQTLDPETNVLLTGVMDELYRRRDASLVILDNKTARFTANQDKLLPLYEVQLYSYAWIAERLGMGKVGALGLVYYEPQTDLTTKTVDEVLLKDGFAMRFQAKVLPLDLRLDRIPPLLQKVRDIYDLATAPTGRTGCKDCRMLDRLMKVAMNNGARAVIPAKAVQG